MYVYPDVYPAMLRLTIPKRDTGLSSRKPHFRHLSTSHKGAAQLASAEQGRARLRGHEDRIRASVDRGTERRDTT